MQVESFDSTMTDGTLRVRHGGKEGRNVVGQAVKVQGIKSYAVLTASGCVHGLRGALGA